MNQPKFKLIIIISTVVIVLIVLLFIFYYNRQLSVTVISDPAGADIIINNVLEKSPAQYKLKPGTYTIWASKIDYQMFKQDCKVSKNNQQINIQLSLEDQTYIPKEGDSSLPIPQPQISNLPYSNDRFKIDWDESNNKYLIVPNIPLTNTDTPGNQIKNNWSQYEQYGKEALEWMKQKGVTPTNDNIEWWFQEFWPQGAQISL